MTDQNSDISHWEIKPSAIKLQDEDPDGNNNLYSGVCTTRQGTFNGRPVIVKAFHFQSLVTGSVMEELVADLVTSSR